MQPQDPSRTTSRGHSSSQSRDARLSEVRGQIDALYNTSSSGGNTNRPTMQPIIGSTPTRQPAPSTSAKAATFSVPNLASKPASHAPVVRHAMGGVQHSQTAYRPGAQAWRQNQAAAASNAHSAPVTRERDISSITPRSRPQAHYIGTSAQVTQSPQPKPTPTRTAASSTARAQQPSSQDNHTEQPAASAHQPQQPDSQRPAGAPRQPTANQKAAWQQYHSAWQNYYQQYYERYYLGQVKKAEERLAEQAKAHDADTPHATAATTDEPEELTQSQAMGDLRSRLLSSIRNGASKVRHSRHFIPAVAGISVMVLFLALQYNRVFFSYVAAYTSPGDLDAQSYIISPYDSTNVGPDPKLIIPKIAVDVPIVWDANAASQASLNAAMDKGVVWFNIPGANAKPGEVGNFVVSGHSSNDWLDNGKYKFIFARLEQMQKGDNIYVNYNGKRYTYTVTGSQVVKPTDVHALQTNATKPTMTLITCVPLGTDLNRLLVTAEQVSPDPSSAKKEASQTTTNSGSNSKSAMPGNSPTFVQRVGNLFSGR